MRSLAYTVLALAVLVVAVFNIFPWVVCGGGAAGVEFTIPDGAGAAEVARMLRARGLVANEDVFLAGARLLGVEDEIRAGKYALSSKTNLFELYDVLRRGQRQLCLVTVPEGLTVEETDSVLCRALGLQAGEIEKYARDRELLKEFGIEAESAEGYLFPDTYDVPVGSSPREVVARMIRKALWVYEEALAGQPPPMGLSRHEVFTLASIVEAEVTYHDEAPRVAAVFFNRLRVGMPLQADPTVAYALGERKRRITYRDLKVDSPYNTYRVKGLPPGPVCSPGRSSIEAVLRPAMPSNDFYFVADGNGRHIFSETIGEHIRAKRRVRARKHCGATGG